VLSRDHDLEKHGAYIYAASPTTEILVAAFRLPHWPTGQTALWHPDYPDLGIFEQGGDFAGLVEAWWTHRIRKDDLRSLEVQLAWAKIQGDDNGSTSTN